MSGRLRGLGHPLLVMLALAGASAGAVHADQATDAKVTVTAGAAGADLHFELAWTAPAARDALTFHLAREVVVTAAAEGGRALTVSSEEVPGTRLVAWRLPVKLAAGAARELTIDAHVAAGDAPGIRVGSDGGVLLPGSGWFPQATKTADAALEHSVQFALPAGWRGVAAGAESAAGSWSTGALGRPYAAWGAYESIARTGTADSSETAFSVWRLGGGDLPDADFCAEVVSALHIGLGAAAGEGDWKIVETSGGGVSGGLRTVFWNASAVGSVSGDAATLRDRDLAAAIATSFWSEGRRFGGELAAFLSRCITQYLGDATYSAVVGGDDLIPLERITLGTRRAAFLERLAADRALPGVVPVSDDGPAVLSTRGAMVAHVLGDWRVSRAQWLVDLRAVRQANPGTTLDWDAFASGIHENAVKEVASLLRTTDLPDFRIRSYGLREGQLKGKTRFAVEVENVGKAAARVQVATFDVRGRTMRTAGLYLVPNDSRFLMFDKAELVARVEVDPRGVVPQADLGEDTVDLQPAKALTEAELDQMVPSFPFSLGPTQPRAVEKLTFELDGASIRDFSGWVVPWRTYHGASGACLLGAGTVALKPGGDFAASWSETMKGDTVVHEGAREMWVRFPLKKWEELKLHLGREPRAEERQEIVKRTTWIQSNSVSAYFAEGLRAQVPPDGSAVVVFRTVDGGVLGFARVPGPDGKVTMRYWDQLTTETLWEERR